MPYSNQKWFYFFKFLTEIFGNAGMMTLPWLSFNVRNKKSKDSCEKIKKKEFYEELEVDEPIPQGPHVTLWGLRTSLYVLRNLICVLQESTYIEFG
jgi:hypothetical protein